MLKQRIKNNIAIAAVAAATGWVFIDSGVTSPSPWALLVAYGAAWWLTRRNAENPGFVVWLDEYTVGIETFDNDHKRLLGLINSLRAAVECHTGEAFERQALLEVIDYTRTHFAREEALMAEHDYPDLEGHKAQHDQMIDYVERFLQRYDDEGAQVLAEVADYLTRWLLQHINHTDQKYRSFFADRGVG